MAQHATPCYIIIKGHRPLKLQIRMQNMFVLADKLTTNHIVPHEYVKGCRFVMARFVFNPNISLNHVTDQKSLLKRTGSIYDSYFTGHEMSTLFNYTYQHSHSISHINYTLCYHSMTKCTLRNSIMKILPIEFQSS